MLALKLRKIGNSLGIVLPKEALTSLKAEEGDVIFNPLVMDQYLENCTETWTYDETYGAWIGYQIKDNETNIIYEFSIELPTTAAIPGFELPILLNASMGIIITLIYVIKKRRR